MAGASSKELPRQLAVLIHPLYLSTLFLLVFNDYVLKFFFPGAITGKLSDFCGIFACFVFFTALLPNHRFSVGVVVAVVFSWWKSPWSQPFIGLLQRHGLPFGRVVDLSDLFALGMIPLAAWWLQRAPARQSKKLQYVVTFVSLFAFAGTSRVVPSEEAAQIAAADAAVYSHHMFGEGPYGCRRNANRTTPKFGIALTNEEIVGRLNRCGIRVNTSFGILPWTGYCYNLLPDYEYHCCPAIFASEDSYVIGKIDPSCNLFRSAFVTLNDTGAGTEIELFYLQLCDGPNFLSEADALMVFERIILGCLIDGTPLRRGR